MFTKEEKNKPVFDTFAKKYCSIDFDECKKKWQDFVDNYDSHLYFRYNNTSKEFEIIDVKGNSISNKGNKLRKKVQTYLLAVGEANLKMAMALFDFLNDVLPAGVISKNLQLNVSDQQSGKNKQINIIDLLFYVTAKIDDLIFPPRREIIDVFKSLQKIYHVPSVFIRNKYFQ